METLIAQAERSDTEEAQAQLINSSLIPCYQSFTTFMEVVQDLASKFLVYWRMICLGSVVEYFT